MKKFIVDLLTNRFGIVLATINLCYLASRSDFRFGAFAAFFVSANTPAISLTVIALELVKFFAGRLAPSTDHFIGGIFLAVFITLQWLSIAWIAKTLAAKIRRL